MFDEEIKQFKLVSGEEIITKVMAWPEEDDMNQIVVCQPMKLVSYEPNPLGPRLYLLRPWMVLQDSPTQHQVLYFDQIIGMAQPSHRMISQYTAVLATFELTDSDQAQQGGEVSEQVEFDSDLTNIITFPGGRTIH